MTKSDSDSLWELLSAYANEALSAEQADALAAQLRNDPAARRAFIEYTDLHSSLAWESSSAADLDDLFKLTLDGAASAAPEDASCEADLQPASRLKRVVDFFFATRARVAMTVAASFLAILLATMEFTPAPKYDSTIVTVQPTSDRVIAARITGSVDSVWQETSLPLGYGSTLYKGQQVELISGTAEVTFLNGAVVTLAGPAVYVIDSDSRSSLRRGELTAVVPERARGFAVQTPSTVLVDLGTEFGVIVADPGDSTEPADEEVHIFKGLVELSVRGSSAAPLKLTENDAVRIVDGKHIEHLTRSDRDRFPREIDEQGDTTTVPPAPSDEKPPVTGGLALWLGADGGMRRDDQGYVYVWEDRIAGDNSKAQNATQHVFGHRPRWIPRALSGKPVVRFDGNDFLTLATPSNLGLINGPYEIFIVARTAAPGIQFLLGGGVEDFELHLNGDAGVRFIPAGFTATGDGSDLGANCQFSDGRAHVFAVRVHADLNHRGRAQVDGDDTAAVTSGDGRSFNNTSLRLGMRHDVSYGLVGDVAEVLIYQRGLSDMERKAVSRYLADKYGISISN